MIEFSRGDVVLIGFVFSDESGIKQRPAVVVSSNEYHRGRQEAIVAAITSQADRLLMGDYLVKEWKEAGLLFPSVTTGIIRTIKQEMVNRKIGTMAANDIQAIDSKLETILNLKTGR